MGSSFNDLIKNGSVTGALLDGGAGSDTISYSDATTGVIIDLGAQLTSNGVLNDRLVSIENAVGSSFNDLIKAGEGSVLTGGAGSDTFDFAAGVGNGQVTDFTLGTDVIQFSVNQFSDFDAIISASTQVGSDTVIQAADLQNAGQFQTITLSDVNIAELQSRDFLIG